MKINPELSKTIKWICIIILIFFGSFFFLNQTLKITYCNFHRIEPYSIDNIILYKYESTKLKNGLCTISCIDSLIFNKEQTINFIKNWNNSLFIGPCLFFPTYRLTAKIKDQSVRKFSISSEGTIKESNDFGFRFLMENKFFEKVWSEK